ncbi:[acyl-carrier-protein] S-malonyltransferase [Floricoccus penangensis]|uniref:Malonyl CoA-acyl carrier protein transacylase n=1 Tax=Floricoccus penangensis TaxID=1859475 RepID=A0A9Q5JGD8_9LACT|nr:ACP S-malonyltransferase [Floricoccus penangensis]OFI46841.1 [acyl-carrier-protein] S-malonyltransferase [Floricoccus penangensis]
MKTAFLFSGQGSQYAGMGLDLYQNESEFRKVFDQASDILGYDLKEIVFTENDLLNETEYTQPAVFTISNGILSILRKNKIEADYVAGLSLGEYSALVASGAIDFSNGLMLVKKRSNLMSAAVPKNFGKMVAVLNTPISIIEQACEQVDGPVSVANYNTPKQIVVGGKSEAVDEFVAILKEDGYKKIIPLNVSGPFHTKVYEPVSRELANIFSEIKWQEMSTPIIGNVQAKIMQKDQLDDLLARQVMSPVRFYQTIDEMINLGVGRFVEIGPGKTLTSFVKKIDKNLETYNIENLKSLQNFLDSYER